MTGGECIQMCGQILTTAFLCVLRSSIWESSVIYLETAPLPKQASKSHLLQDFRLRGFSVCSFDF